MPVGSRDVSLQMIPTWPVLEAFVLFNYSLVVKRFS